MIGGLIDAFKTKYCGSKCVCERGFHVEIVELKYDMIARLTEWQDSRLTRRHMGEQVSLEIDRAGVQAGMVSSYVVPPMTKDELLTQLHHAMGEWMTAEMAYRNAVQQVRHANELARQAEDRLTVAALRKSSALEAFEAYVTAKASVAAVNAGSSVRPTFSVSDDD